MCAAIWSAGFPYGIYYTIEADTVVIWAVKHLRRDPDYWQVRRR
jgi:hypothetical protein